VCTRPRRGHVLRSGVPLRRDGARARGAGAAALRRGTGSGPGRRAGPRGDRGGRRLGGGGRRCHLVLRSQSPRAGQERHAPDGDPLLARHAIRRRGRLAHATSRRHRSACAHRLSDPHELLAGEARVARADRAACIPRNASLRLVLRLPLRPAARSGGGDEHRDGDAHRARRPGDACVGRGIARRARPRCRAAPRDLGRARRRVVSGAFRRSLLQPRRRLRHARARGVDGRNLRRSENGLRDRAGAAATGALHSLVDDKRVVEGARCRTEAISTPGSRRP
jgi:hypothetical protein